MKSQRKLLEKTHYKYGVCYLGLDSVRAEGIDVLGVSSNFDKIRLEVFDYTKFRYERGFSKMINRKLTKNKTFRYNNTTYNVDGII